jgi:hypothetical protein
LPADDGVLGHEDVNSPFPGADASAPFTFALERARRVSHSLVADRAKCQLAQPGCIRAYNPRVLCAGPRISFFCKRSLSAEATFVRLLYLAERNLLADSIA